MINNITAGSHTKKTFRKRNGTVEITLNLNHSIFAPVNAHVLFLSLVETEGKTRIKTCVKFCSIGKICDGMER